MKSSTNANFKQKYQTHLKHLKLKGLQPNTINAHFRAIRCIGTYFDHQSDDLSKPQLTNYFTDLMDSHSWSAIKLDLYSLKFHYMHVLRKLWVSVALIKLPSARRLPDMVSVDKAKRLIMGTFTFSCRVFYFTFYRLGLRLGEGLRLEVGDIDAPCQCVHVRDSKGNKDRLVPLPDGTLTLLRRFRGGCNPSSVPVT